LHPTSSISRNARRKLATRDGLSDTLLDQILR